MSNKNSVYTVPRAVIELVFRAKGLPVDGPPRTQSTARRVAKATTLLESQWRRLMLSTDYGLLNDILAVRYLRNGQLKLVPVDQKIAGDIELVMPHRFIDQEFANTHIAKHLSWAEFKPCHDGTHGALELVASSGTSNLRASALRAAAKQAREELGRSAIPAGTNFTLRPSSGGDYSDYESGISLHQLYWALYVIKKVTDDLTAMMRLGLRGDISTVVEVKRHDTSEAFGKFLAKRAQLAPISSKSIENLPVPKFTDPASRTWGIEVEAAGARGVECQNEDWDRRDDGSLRSAYGGYGHDRSPSDCPHHDHREEVENDDGEYISNEDYDDIDWCAWYNDEEGDYSDCAEFVSPILHSAGDADLKQLLGDLIEEPQNDSAGIHIHVGAEDMSPRQIGGLVFGYQMIEPIITEAYRRQERGYCRSRSSGSLIETLKSTREPGARKSRSDYGTGDVINYGDRYLSLNLQSLESHGTVEFRAMGPVYEYDHLIKWALFCREMVNMAKADVPAKVWTSIKTWSDLQAAIQRYGKELKALTIAEMEKSIAKSEDLVTA